MTGVDRENSDGGSLDSRSEEESPSGSDSESDSGEQFFTSHCTPITLFRIEGRVFLFYLTCHTFYKDSPCCQYLFEQMFGYTPPSTDVAHGAQIHCDFSLSPT